MDIPLYLFEADQQRELLFLIGSLLGTALAIGLLVYLRRKPIKYENRHYKQLGQMLSGIVIVICLGTVTGMLYNLRQLGAVKVFNDRVETGRGTVSYDNLKYVFLKKGLKNSFVAPGVVVDTTLMAYFEEKGGRSYVFSEENYDVEAIVRSIRPILDSLQQNK